MRRFRHRAFRLFYHFSATASNQSRAGIQVNRRRNRRPRLEGYNIEEQLLPLKWVAGQPSVAEEKVGSD